MRRAIGGARRATTRAGSSAASRGPAPPPRDRARPTPARRRRARRGPFSRRSMALRQVRHDPHSSRRTYGHDSETWCGRRSARSSPHAGHRILGNVHSTRQSEQRSVRRPLISGSSRSTAARGGAPQYGHAARSAFSPATSATPPTLPSPPSATRSLRSAPGSPAPPGSVACTASASAMGWTKARGKNSSAAGSQSSRAATASTGRRDRDAPNRSGHRSRLRRQSLRHRPQHVGRRRRHGPDETREVPLARPFRNPLQAQRGGAAVRGLNRAQPAGLQRPRVQRLLKSQHVIVERQHSAACGCSARRRSTRRRRRGQTGDGGMP